MVRLKVTVLVFCLRHMYVRTQDLADIVVDTLECTREYKYSDVDA
jgi:hypothetical protein